jgi:hypothetical protein
MLLYANENNRSDVVRLADVTDGTSNTLMVGEVTESLNARPGVINTTQFPTWAAGNNDAACNGITGACNTFRIAGCLRTRFNGHATEWRINVPRTITQSNECFSSKHPGGANFVLGDASTRFIPQTVSDLVLAAIATRNQQESVQMP